MTQLTNDALYEQLSESYGITAGDDLYFFAGASTAQGAGPVKGQLHRIVVNAVAGAALTMKSILSNDAPSFVWIINDGAQSVNVFPFKQNASLTQETMNGVANASQAVAAGAACLFMSTPVQIKRKGGTSGGGTLDWRAAVIN